MYIISRNYRDRASPYKWLIRRSGEEPGAARACKRVEARGVRFRESDYEELGFGCAIVAEAEDAVAHDFEPLETAVGMPLHFDGDQMQTATGRPVTVCDELTLTDAGIILAANPR